MRLPWPVVFRVHCSALLWPLLKGWPGFNRQAACSIKYVFPYFAPPSPAPPPSLPLPTSGCRRPPDALPIRKNMGVGHSNIGGKQMGKSAYGNPTPLVTRDSPKQGGRVNPRPDSCLGTTFYSTYLGRWPSPSGGGPGRGETGADPPHRDHLRAQRSRSEGDRPGDWRILTTKDDDDRQK